LDKSGDSPVALGGDIGLGEELREAGVFGLIRERKLRDNRIVRRKRGNRSWWSRSCRPSQRGHL